jgi:Outer membrane lipoprotein-sorting protein
MTDPKRHIRWAILLCGLLITAPSSCLGAVPEGADSSEGEKLAAQLRATPPLESMTLAGRLNMREGGGAVRDVPFQFRTLITPTNWLTIYRVTASTVPTPPLLAVIHEVGQPNGYWESEAATPDAWKPLDGISASRAFADSDFSIFDLGLEFLHWPIQRVVKAEMRKSRSCKVLESVNAHVGPKEYRRVVSWIDAESGGLLVAEAYDEKDKLLKEFTVNSMKKINDRWHVQQMEIRNSQTKSRTRLDFDVK